MAKIQQSPPLLRVDVVEPGGRARSDANRCVIDEDIRFSTESLEAYCFSNWNSVIYDALLLAGAIEYCDKIRKRPGQSWGRSIDLKIPVHDPTLWKQERIQNALLRSLCYLTGDAWNISFRKRKMEIDPPNPRFELPSGLKAVIPFSDGIDSLAVAELEERALLKQGHPNALIRVRLGPKTVNGKKAIRGKLPFTVVPYKVTLGKKPSREFSGRSRGFRFMLLAGIAASLIDVQRIIVPESGQGIFGPVLVPVGQTYGDCRNHPMFADHMKQFLNALFGKQFEFSFPRWWSTKAETISEFALVKGSENDLFNTKSCWQNNMHVGVNGRTRQCGICAACMLRRMSFHAAGIQEPAGTYVWENLNAPSFHEAADEFFDEKKRTDWQKEYAIAGVLHLKHLAQIRRSSEGSIRLNNLAFQLAGTFNLDRLEVRAMLERMLNKHETEWEGFIHSLRPESFIRNWAEPLK